MYYFNILSLLSFYNIDLSLFVDYACILLDKKKMAVKRILSLY